MGKKRRADDVEAADGAVNAEATEVTKASAKKAKKKASRDKTPEIVVAEAPAEGKAERRAKRKGATAPDAPAAAGDTAVASDSAAGGGDKRRRHTSAPPETLQYLTEVVAHFGTLTEGEEKELLVGNVLEELQGKEALVAGDQVCSRHMEVLLGGASCSQLLQFLQSVCSADDLQALASSPFGSHVLEKVLIAVDKALKDGDEELLQATQQTLEPLNAIICGQLGAYITDRYATHVARRLLCVAAGRNVLPTNKQQQGQYAAKMKGPSGLAARVGSGKASSDAAGSTGPRYPQLIQAAAQVLCREDYQGNNMADIVYSTYGAPYLQGMLNAIVFDRQALLGLIPCILCATYFYDSAKAGKVLEGVPAEGFLAMVRDSTASHVVEVVLQVAPPTVFEELHSRFFQGKLLELCSHASANFVVQAAIAAATSAAQVRGMYEELSGSLGELMKRRRSGVVAALVAACGGRACCQKEICVELEKVLLSLPGWSGLTPEQALAPALLCLDSATVLGPNADPGVQGLAARLSTLGASILVCILGYGQGACRNFTDSVAALQGADVARVGADPAGSRVLEALLEGSAPAKVKQRLMSNLKGSYGKVAMTGAGSFLVERCYERGDMDVKEAIVSELVTALKQLQGTHWGPSLLQRVGAEAYARDPEQWRRHAVASLRAMAEFTQLFDGDGGKGGKGGRKKKGGNDSSKKDAESLQQLVSQAEGHADAGGGNSGHNEHREKKEKKEKKRKQREGVQSDAGGPEQAGPAPASEDRAQGQGNGHAMHAHGSDADVTVGTGGSGRGADSGPELKGAAADVLATLGFGVGAGVEAGAAGKAGAGAGAAKQGLSGAERRKAKRKAQEA